MTGRRAEQEEKTRTGSRRSDRQAFMGPCEGTRGFPAEQCGAGVGTGRQEGMGTARAVSRAV